MSIVLERPLYDALAQLAQRDGVPLSVKTHDLLRNSVEVRENRLLAQIAKDRERLMDPTRMLPHDAVWRPPGRRRR